MAGVRPESLLGCLQALAVFCCRPGLACLPQPHHASVIWRLGMHHWLLGMCLLASQHLLAHPLHQSSAHATPNRSAAAVSA